MTEPTYPVRREARRVRRWFETAGAEYRLVAPVCPSPRLRAWVESSFRDEGRLAMVPLEVSSGDLLPVTFREHRGNHASFLFFVFSGLAARIARDGRPAIDALERDADLFTRPATWSLVWLEDPALPALLARLAPRWSAAVQLHPVFADAALDASDGAAAIRDLLRAALPGTTAEPSAAAAAERALRRGVERGDRLGLVRGLRTSAIDPGRLLLAEGDAARLGGDVQAALAAHAAAASFGAEPGEEGRAGVAELLAHLGDAGGARARAESVLDQRPAAGAAARAALALAELARREGKSVSEAIERGAAWCANDPAALRALAQGATAGGATALAAALLERASADTAPDTELAELAAIDLALLLARSGAGDDARLRLEPLAHRGRDPLVRARATRALGRVALEQAGRAIETGEPATAELSLATAERELASAVRLAEATGAPLEVAECRLEELALAAARQDLAAVLRVLEALEAHARAAGLRRVLFETLEHKARALRFAGEMARAVGTLDELENLAYDLTLPELERRAFEARADHLDQLELDGEARAARRKAAEVADGLNQPAPRPDSGSR